MFGWITEPLCWAIALAYLPYAACRLAATDDARLREVLVPVLLALALMTVHSLPVLDTLVLYLPFYFELKFLLLAGATFFPGAGLRLYKRLVRPVFRRFSKTPEQLAGGLPAPLRTQYDASESLEQFASKHVVQLSATVLAEHGEDAYRLVMAMLIQSARARALAAQGGDVTGQDDGGNPFASGAQMTELGKIGDRARGVAARLKDVGGAIKTSVDLGLM